MRMSMRRFTRLTNAFSKKVENHAAAVALYFTYYELRPRASDVACHGPRWKRALPDTSGASRISSDF
jgi:hypothetical protein